MDISELNNDQSAYCLAHSADEGFRWSLAAEDQSPTVEAIAAKGTISIDWTFAIGMRWLVYHNPKIVVALGALSSEVFGHGGRYIAGTSCASNFAL